MFYRCNDIFNDGFIGNQISEFGSVVFDGVSVIFGHCKQ